MGNNVYQWQCRPFADGISSQRGVYLKSASSRSEARLVHIMDDGMVRWRSVAGDAQSWQDWPQIRFVDGEWDFNGWKLGVSVSTQQRLVWRSPSSRETIT
eukprot:gene57091-biopygen50122